MQKNLKKKLLQKIENQNKEKNFKRIFILSKGKKKKKKEKNR